MQVDKVVRIDDGRKAPRSKRGLIKIEPLNEDDRQCLEYWNSFGIMKHKETKIGLHDAIDFALSNFDCEDVKTAITHYQQCTMTRTISIANINGL